MSKELLQGLASVKTSNVLGSHARLEDGYIFFTGKYTVAATESYIPIEDYTHTFEYDITYESDAGNYFYVGIEKYAADKTTGTNSSCSYMIATNNEAKTKQRVRGTVNMDVETSAGNKPAYIRLRILNQWTGSSGTNVTAKIYRISFREITEDTNKISIKKQGQLTTDTIWEAMPVTSFNKLNVVECNNLCEY